MPRAWCKRPWCCPEPRCTPVFQLKDSDYEDIAIPVTGESFFCFGMMERPVAFTYDGVEHNNDLNSCSYTALKGVIRFQENENDWEALEIAYRRARQKVKDIRGVAAPAERTRVEGEQFCPHLHQTFPDTPANRCLDCDTILRANPSDSARRAAEEIAANYEVHKDRCHSNERYPSPPCDCGAIEEVAAIIERHAAAPADNEAESFVLTVPEIEELIQGHESASVQLAQAGKDYDYHLRRLEQLRRMLTTTKGDR